MEFFNANINTLDMAGPHWLEGSHNEKHLRQKHMCYKSPNFTTIRLRSLKKDTPQPHKTKMSLGFQTMQALYEPPVSVNKRTKGKPPW